MLNNTYVLALGPIILCSFLYISVTFPVAVCCVSIWTRGSCVCNSRGGHDSRWHSNPLSKRENGDSFSLFGWWRAVESCNIGVHTDNTWQTFREATRTTRKCATSKIIRCKNLAKRTLRALFAQFVTMPKLLQFWRDLLRIWNLISQRMKDTPHRPLKNVGYRASN